MSSEIETLMKYLSLGPDDEGVGISYMSEISSGGNENSSKIIKWPAVLPVSYTHLRAHET